ncbi:hypothetical protein SDC9_117600 [bioreactor metagenome]|uniref:Uncharacterized protein n=1 Tax=bioreactor metagenome TaxID=1076179 RepID=A0A645BZF8_9ZZZZ
MTVQYVGEDYCPPEDIKLLAFQYGRIQNPPTQLDNIYFHCEFDIQFCRGGPRVLPDIPKLLNYQNGQIQDLPLRLWKISLSIAKEEIISSLNFLLFLFLFFQHLRYQDLYKREDFL